MGDTGALEKLPVSVGTPSMVSLRGPSGYLLKLQGTGAKSVQWAPVDRRAQEVEVRALLITHTRRAPVTRPALVRVRVNYGHGAIQWLNPRAAAYSPGFAGGVFPLPGFVLPARGAVWRMSTREATVTFDSPGTTDPAAAPYDECSLQISFQPVFCSRPPLFPRSDVVLAGPGGVFKLGALPAEADSLRIWDVDTGLPYAAGVLNVRYVDTEGNLSAVTDANLLADFHPIPTQAIAIIGVPVAPIVSFYMGIEFR